MGVSGLGFGVWGHGLGCSGVSKGFSVFGCRALDLELFFSFFFWGGGFGRLGFGLWSFEGSSRLGFRAQGLWGFKVLGFRLPPRVLGVFRALGFSWHCFRVLGFCLKFKVLVVCGVFLVMGPSNVFMNMF